MSSLGVGEPMDCLSVRNYPDPDSCPDSDVGEGLPDSVLPQFELGIGGRVDIGIDGCESFIERRGKYFEDIDVFPEFFGGGGDGSEDFASFVETDGPERGDSDEVEYLFRILLDA